MALSLPQPEIDKTIAKVTANIANAHHTFGHKQVSAKTMEAVNLLVASGQLDSAFHLLTVSAHKHPSQVADIYHSQAQKQRVVDVRARLREKLRSRGL